MYLYPLFWECLHIPYSAAGCCANYAVRRERDTLYIFFEKSNGAVDWKSNLDFPAVAYPRSDGSVWYAHRGFLAVWRKIEPMLAASIADATVRAATVTGYSHGGAIALLCHEYIWYHRPDLRARLFGYGFGCPRVFWGKKNGELLKRFEQFTVIRNLDDIVTHLPPFLLGYSHVGKLLTVGKRGKYSPIDAHKAENILTELAGM